MPPPQDLPQWFDIRTLLPQKCNSILDIGCGSGETLTFCSHIARRVGVDLDSSAISKAAARVPDGEFLVARGESLPFSDASFDAIVSCVALPYMNIPRVFRECARVLRPGGMLYISVHTWGFLNLLWSTKTPNLAGRVYRAYVTLNGLSFHLFGRVFPYPLRPSLIESFQTERGLKHSLAIAGFHDFRNLHRRVPSFSAVRVAADCGNVALTAQSDADTTAKYADIDVGPHDLRALKVTDIEASDASAPVTEKGDRVRKR